MAITGQIDEATYKKLVAEGRGNEVEVVQHGHDDRLLYLRRTHGGLVVRTYEKNYYGDSDFIAVVWDPERGEPREICYASTSFWTYFNGAKVDAPPEVMAAYEAWVAKKREREKLAALFEEARLPRVGGKARVVRGRKVPIGTEGTIFWKGKDKWGNDRCGVRDAEGVVHWTALANLEIIPTCPLCGEDGSAGE